MAVYGGVEQNSGGVCGCARGMGSGGGLERRCADCVQHCVQLRGQ